MVRASSARVDIPRVIPGAAGRSDHEGGGAAEADLDGEREFILAIEAYKKSSGRLFPTWSEVLEVLRELGYEKAE